MLTPSSTSQSRITRNEPNIVLNVRVSLPAGRRGAGGTQAHCHRVLPDIESRDPLEHDLHPGPLSAVRDPRPAPGRPSGGFLCQDTDPRARSNNPAATEEPRAIHLYGLSRTSVKPTSPDGTQPRFSSPSAAISKSRNLVQTRESPDRGHGAAASGLTPGAGGDAS